MLLAVVVGVGQCVMAQVHDLAEAGAGFACVHVIAVAAAVAAATATVDQAHE